MRLASILSLLLLFGTLTGCNRSQDTNSKEASGIIFLSPDGRKITMDDLRGLSGTFDYEIIGNVKVPEEADSLHKRAREAGEAGDYRKALINLERASQLAPQWPYPVYDMAFTYLLMKDFENARTYYRKTIDLSPRGFFTAITAFDTLLREKKGDLPEGTYLSYSSLEWMDDPAKKMETVKQFVKEVPTFAPAWKELAILSDGDDEKLAAIEKGLAAHPDAETMGILQINKALILDRKGNHDVAVRLLGELALDPSSTFATEHLAKVTLASVAKK
jgi:tetratricopeptide (TPR) repeat protein